MKNKTLSLEDLPQISFSDIEVNTDEVSRVRRKVNLRKALKLGNIYKRKVYIYFKNLEGILKKIEVSVWAVGEDFVSLKAGYTIPIKSIDHIEF
tara:strand:- start:2866 stop:3147 length:282 start_codon:yes stop_codon:yes gene_type:complete